jgi:hypothetical protein
MTADRRKTLYPFAICCERQLRPHSSADGRKEAHHPGFPNAESKTDGNRRAGRLSFRGAAKLKHASRGRHREFYRPLPEPMPNSRPAACEPARSRLPRRCHPMISAQMVANSLSTRTTHRNCGGHQPCNKYRRFDYTPPSIRFQRPAPRLAAVKAFFNQSERRGSFS